jgi:hypothetical protein
VARALIGAAREGADHAPLCDTRKLPLDVAIRAPLPVEASGELASMVSVIAPPDTLELRIAGINGLFLVAVLSD